MGNVYGKLDVWQLLRGRAGLVTIIFNQISVITIEIGRFKTPRNPDEYACTKTG
jgi:hypothetical protein